MRATGIGLVALLIMALPATAAAQGADLGYGGILGDEQLVAPGGGGGGAGPPNAVAELPPSGQLPAASAPGPGAEAGAPAEGVSAPPTGAGGGSLPFTGLDLAAIAAAGLLMVLMGAALRRRGSAAA